MIPGSVNASFLSSVSSVHPRQFRTVSAPFLMSSVASKDGIFQVQRSINEVKKDDENDIKSTIKKEYNIAYRVFRPMNLSSQKAAPILVLHGGPSVPSDYLYPLVDVVPYRSIIFYDQLGCGRSDEPSPNEGEMSDIYSIDLALDDLEHLLKRLNVRKFHLYGQSFGGILAFEYLKRIANRRGENSIDSSQCLSAVISSSPTSVKKVEEEAGRLLNILKDEDSDESTLGERFRIRHQCNTPEMPKPLVDAYNHAGTTFRGTAAISTYIAKPPSSNATRMASAMVLRGENDFVTKECVEEWKNLFNHNYVREKEMEGCTHHGLLEMGKTYGDTLESFFCEYD